MNDANTALLERICQIKGEHPAWGYRRVWAYIRLHDRLQINHKRVYRLMKMHGLMVPKQQNLKALRTPSAGKPRTVEPNHIWGTDMTKIRLTGGGWAYLHLVLDWGSKKIVGHQLSHRSRAEDWLAALDRGLNSQFPDGIRAAPQGLSLVSDNGCQPTGKTFMAACRALGIQQIFTSYNNPKGNADTERVFRTLKEDLIWVNEFASYQQLEIELRDWIHRYNHDYPHSSLGYQTPYQYETWFKAATRSA